MAPRKQTPDVLNEILGGEPAPAQPPAPRPQAAPRSKRAPAAASGRSPARKPAWEYMEVVFRDYGGYRPRCINGQEQPGWKRLPVIHEYLNELGEQGWELAGLGSRENCEMPAYFKRPK
jgi:hypothetical protein